MLSKNDIKEEGVITGPLTYRYVLKINDIHTVSDAFAVVSGVYWQSLAEYLKEPKRRTGFVELHVQYRYYNNLYISTNRVIM